MHISAYIILVNKQAVALQCLIKKKNASSLSRASDTCKAILLQLLCMFFQRKIRDATPVDHPEFASEGHPAPGSVPASPAKTPAAQGGQAPLKSGIVGVGCLEWVETG